MTGVQTCALPIYSSSSSTSIAFATNSGGAAAAEAMRIDSSGNVGIGTTSPTVKLHVYGSSGPSMYVNDSAGVTVYVNANGNTDGRIGTLSNHPLQIITNSTIAATVLANGNVGIGTSSPAQKLDVSGTIRSNGAVLYTNNAVTVTSNAGTVPVTAKLNTFTNSSAATMTITMATASATDGQMTIVRIYDFSAVAQTITWVNTENSTVTAPTTSNGSTTLPLTVGFMYNSQTSKWRCIASA